MADFAPFALAVHKRFNQISKHELFVVGELGNNRAFEAHYLASFPEGTNPVYITNTEHDCSCCKNFIRNLGNAVAIVDGKVLTVWDDCSKLEHPYNVVGEAMRAFVLSQPVTALFRPTEPKYGAEQSLQATGSGVKKWKHFHGVVDKRHMVKDVGTVRGDYDAAVQVFRRGLVELTGESVATVMELIQDKALYRGEEHLAMVNAFYTLWSRYRLDGVSKELYVWEHAKAFGAAIRNTVIGTLLIDLSAGVDVETAVKSFEAKVAPANYKRPKALITPRMVEDAMKTIRELDLEPSLERRFAKISDISVNNVLWVDASAQAKMKGGIEGLLMSAAAGTPKVDKAEDIKIDDFMSRILPGARGIELLVKNQHRGNFVSLTAPVHTDTARLFKWHNDFAWSYHGNIADSELRRSVAERGGRVDGVFRFSHSWNYGKRNASLMDLHVFMPGSTKKFTGQPNDEYGNHNRVGWNHRKGPANGVQDVDYTAEAPVGYVPVENITFPTLEHMPEGQYECAIHNWKHRTPTEGGFRAEIEFGGQVFEYEFERPLKNKEWVRVATVTLRAGQFSIEHHLPTQASSQSVWSIDTEKFAKVDTLMFSPNYWDGQGVGNKHFLFMLEGCQNPEPTRGIYNEFLSSDLDKHRRVFEVLGDKTKCQPVPDQLSGLGFSSTRGDTVTVRVKSHSATRMYNVQF